MANNLPMIMGIGYAVPSKVVTNNDLTSLYDTSDEWIYSRTGIKERRVFASDDEAFELLRQACNQAVKNAGLDVNDIDLIIAATSMPVQLMPSTSCMVQKLLNISRNIPAFDISVACSGFVYGLDIANAYIRSGVYKNILLVTMDNCSRYIDWTDRRTSILFGDGIGAAVISAGNENDILAIDIKADGHVGDYIKMPVEKGNCPFVDKTPTPQVLDMKGQEVYKFVANIIPPYIIEDILGKNNIKAENVEYLILHQANQRIIKAVQERLGYDDSKVISNIENLGNTSASSILIATGEAIKNGNVKTPAKAIVCGFGAGMCWGAGVIRLRDGVFRKENIFQK
ncbi:MAG: ketoacyl-ACP synthase III [Alphaproteobacteria bacterium]|nr:ketoacyl-ACP synthase III [Alphaproteobacteria bacterium]